MCGIGKFKCDVTGRQTVRRLHTGLFQNSKKMESQNLQNCAGNSSQTPTPTVEPAQPTTEVEPQLEADKALKHLVKARKLELELRKMKGELENYLEFI